MTQELFDKVMLEIYVKKEVDSERIAYFPEEYNIAKEEFSDVFNYLSKLAGGLIKRYINNTYFPELIFNFKYKEKVFQWRLIIGQGSSYQIYMINKKEDIDATIVDCDMKFHKVVSNGY